MAKNRRKHSSTSKFLYGWARWGFEGSDLEKEYVFHEERKWRFDVAFPSLKVAVEFDGFGFGHQSKGAREKDNEKSNAAIEEGWYVLRYTTAKISKTQVQNTVEQVCRVLMSRSEELGQSGL